jgi:hypothetical protein
MKYAKIKKYLFRLSKVNWGDSQTHRQQGDLRNVRLFFINKESRSCDTSIGTATRYELDSRSSIPVRE